MADEKISYLEKELFNLEQLLQEQIAEKEATKKLLEEIEFLKEIPSGQELIVPIARGIFAKLTIQQFKNFVVNVGNNVLVEKNLSEVKNLLQENIKIIDENINAIKLQQEKIINYLKNMQNPD
ncbi:MAG: hypothetical protein QXD62_03365 [Candidatus Woesearchaeota archaeon]